MPAPLSGTRPYRMRVLPLVSVVIVAIAIIGAGLLAYTAARVVRRLRRMGLVRSVEMDVSAVPEMLRIAETALLEYTGVPLDYTAESLERIERMVDDLRKVGGPTFELSILLSALGCYAGEVMIRNLGGQWMAGDPRGSDPVLPEILGLRPKVISKVFKRFYYLKTYADESVVYLYQIAAKYVHDQPRAAGAETGRSH